MPRSATAGALRGIVIGLILAAAALPGTVAAAERGRLPSEEALEPCPEYGADFGRIPGTTQCIRASERAITGAQSGNAARVPVTRPIGLTLRGYTQFGSGAPRR